MYRGTTPTLTFTLPFDSAELTVCSIAFAQGDTVVLEKTLSDCQRAGRTLSVTLTERDTLRFDCNKNVKIQLRCGCGEARLASQIISANVERILKDGCL